MFRIKIKTTEPDTIIEIKEGKVTANKPIWILEVPEDITGESMQEYKAESKPLATQSIPFEPPKKKQKSVKHINNKDKYTKQLKKDVINKTKSDPEFVKDLGVNKKTLQKYRSRWKKEFGMKMNIDKKKAIQNTQKNSKKE